jgi:hypothetical protein
MSSPVVVTISKDGSVRIANLLFEIGTTYYLVDERTDEKFSYVADKSVSNTTELLQLWKNMRAMTAGITTGITA